MKDLVEETEHADSFPVSFLYPCQNPYPKIACKLENGLSCFNIDFRVLWLLLLPHVTVLPSGTGQWTMFCYVTNFLTPRIQGSVPQ